MTDESIVLELKRGNNSVLKHCYGKPFSKVRSMVLKAGGSVDDAKDLFHDSLIILCKNCKKEGFELTSSLDTYIYAISKYQWLNELKKRKKEQKETDLMVDVSDVDFDLSYKSVDEIVGHVIDAIQKLGDSCKNILMDYYYGRLSYDEIALSLGYSNGQVVRQQKYRCIKKLKEMTEYVFAG